MLIRDTRASVPAHETMYKKRKGSTLSYSCSNTPFRLPMTSSEEVTSQLMVDNKMGVPLLFINTSKTSLSPNTEGFAVSSLRPGPVPGKVRDFIMLSDCLGLFAFIVLFYFFLSRVLSYNLENSTNC